MSPSVQGYGRVCQGAWYETCGTRAVGIGPKARKSAFAQGGVGYASTPREGQNWGDSKLENGHRAY